MANVRSMIAVDIICDRLHRLDHPSGVVRLVQFSHDSPGLRKIRRQIAEALVMLLENSGFYLCNGLEDAADVLVEHGYAVTAPVVEEPTPTDIPATEEHPLQSVGQ